MALSTSLSLLPTSGLEGVISEITLALIVCDSVTRKRCICRIVSTVSVLGAHLCSHSDPLFHFSSHLKRECPRKDSEQKSNASCQFPKSAPSPRTPSSLGAPHRALSRGNMHHQSPHFHSHRGSQARTGTDSMPPGFLICHPPFLWTKDLWYQVGLKAWDTPLLYPQVPPLIGWMTMSKQINFSMV